MKDLALESFMILRNFVQQSVSICLIVFMQQIIEFYTNQYLIKTVAQSRTQKKIHSTHLE